jgi:hypothetical protein
MRWLMIVFLVSLVALLVASAGVAHHVWRERSKRRQAAPAPPEKADNPHSNRNTNRAANPDTEEAP